MISVIAVSAAMNPIRRNGVRTAVLLFMISALAVGWSTVIRIARLSALEIIERNGLNLARSGKRKNVSLVSGFWKIN